MTIPELNSIERDCRDQLSRFPKVKWEDLKEILDLARKKLQDIEDTNLTGQDAPQ